MRLLIYMFCSVLLAPGVLQFDAFNYWVNETDQQVTLKVLRLNGSAGRVYAVWRTAEGTARSPEDYPFQEGRLVFDDGVTEASLNISVENDRVTELDEYFTVSLINANLGATLGYPSEANVTIKATLHGQASFLTAEYVFEENVGRIRIPVERTNGSAGSVTLAWRTKPLTASSTQDYKDGQGILTFKDGVTKEFIYINILDDKVPEEDELFQIVLSQPTGGLVLGNLLVTTIKILKNDADPSQLQFETSNYRVKEQDEQVTLKVLRVKGKAGMVYGLWRTEMGTARHPDDYPYQEGQLVFPDGVAEVSFNVTVEFDTAAETDEYFKVTLINIPLGAVLGSPTEVNVTIQDTYRQPGEVSFLRTSYEYEENAGQINISVERFKGNYGIVTFTWYTRSLAAKSPEDYFGGPEVLTFQDGETKKVITLKIVDDTTPEGDEVFEIMLSQPTGGLVVGDIPVTRVKIHENDGPGALQFEAPNYWIREIDQQVTLKVLRVNGSAGRVYGLWRTVEGTARNPDDYQYQEGRLVFEDGVTEASLNISVDDDGVSELDEYFTVTLFNLNLGATLGYPYTATVTIKSRLHGQSSFQKAEYVFNENAGQVPISVERKNGSDGRVAVEWRTVPLTATSPEDYDGAQGTLTFKDGETEQLIYIYIVDDKVPEEDERFQIVLSQPTGGLSLGNIHVTTIRIFKNDGVPGKLQFKMSNYRVEEKDEQVTLTVLRVRGSAGRVYGMWRTVEGTARHPHDYPYQEGLLKFDDGVTEVNFNVSVEYDAPAETDEYFKVILINIPLGAALGSPTEANVTIQDTPMPTTTTTATTTIATTTISTTAPACGDIADVVFIIDSSGSIRDNDPPGRNNWKDLLSFVSDVIGKWDIGTRQVRVGLVTFSNLGNYKWSLNTYTQKGALQERVKRVGYSGGRTNLSAGLLVARNRVFQRYAGDRAGVPNIAVVITDGAYSSKKADVQRELNQYQKLEIRIFAVGITRQAQEDQVKSISSDPSVRGINYWMAPGFQDLNAIRDGLVAALNPYTKVKCP